LLEELVAVVAVRVKVLEELEVIELQLELPETIPQQNHP
jgi:hypothetical protein